MLGLECFTPIFQFVGLLFILFAALIRSLLFHDWPKEDTLITFILFALGLTIVHIIYYYLIKLIFKISILIEIGFEIFIMLLFIVINPMDITYDLFYNIRNFYKNTFVLEVYILTLIGYIITAIIIYYNSYQKEKDKENNSNEI